MPDIYHDFPVFAPPDKVFQVISLPAGLDVWWTKRSAGNPGDGSTYEFWFAPEYDWRGVVRKFAPGEAIEWEMTRADIDWTGTRVGFELSANEGYTLVRFYHKGWPDLNDHFRTSSYCWAMYLRIMKRYIEAGETVPYEKRLDV